MNKATSYLSGLRDRKKRRQRFLRTIGIIGLMCLVLISGLWFVLHSGIFFLSNIEVEGNESLSEEQIITLVWSQMFKDSPLLLFLGIRNILAWPLELHGDDLALLPKVKRITVIKDYRTRSIIISVEERERVGVWCFKKQTPAYCSWFDEEGIIFQRTFSGEGSLIIVVNDFSRDSTGLGASVLEKKFLNNIFSIFKAIQDVGMRVKEIRLEDISLQEISISTHDGPDLYFSVRFPADNTRAAFESIKEETDFSKIEYIDFRVENRAYYK